MKFYTPKIIITPIQSAKSKSLFELINLIQIIKTKRRRNFADFFLSYSHTLFSATLLVRSQAEKTRDIMSSKSVFTREWLSLN